MCVVMGYTHDNNIETIKIVKRIRNSYRSIQLGKYGRAGDEYNRVN